MLVFILDSKNVAAAKMTERSVQAAVPDCSCILIASDFAIHMNRILSEYDKPFFLTLFAGEQLATGFQNQFETWLLDLSERAGGMAIDPLLHQQDDECAQLRGPVLWRTMAVNAGAFPGFQTTQILPFESYVLLERQFALEESWPFKCVKSNQWLPRPPHYEGWRKRDIESSVILPILRMKQSGEQWDEAPHITVVICTFNNADYLLWAIRSVCMQSYPAWELLIVDDGSTDGTQAIWESSPYAMHPRIRFIRNGTNRGKAACLNQALIAAKGEWLLELDADDWLDTTCMHTLINHMAISPDGGMVYADHMDWYERSDKNLVLNMTQHEQGDMTVDKLLKNAIPLAPRMYSIQTVTDLGGWSAADPFHGRLYEDFQMLARIMLERPAAYIQKALYHRRIRSSSITHQHPDSYSVWTNWLLEFICSNKRMDT